MVGTTIMLGSLPDIALTEIKIMMPDSGTTSFLRPETNMRTARCGCSRKNISPAEHVELSLDIDILDALRALGEDWEAHFNAILRDWLRSNSPVAA
jgi:uncharacterized protein (DUF4415 family)